MLTASYDYHRTEDGLTVFTVNSVSNTDVKRPFKVMTKDTALKKDVTRPEEGDFCVISPNGQGRRLPKREGRQDDLPVFWYGSITIEKNGKKANPLSALEDFFE